MSTRKRPTPADPADPAVDRDSLAPNARAWEELIESFTPEMTVKLALRRLPSYLTPQVQDQEVLPPPAFRPSMDDMQAEILTRFGPGRYKLWIKWHDPSGRNKTLAPDFVLGAPTAPAGMEGEPGPPVSDTSAMIADAADKLGNAVRLKAQAAELSALSSLADGPAPAAPDPLAHLKSTAELLKSLQPNTLDTLRAAVELVRPAQASGGVVEQLSAVEKIVSILASTGFGGGGGPAAKTGAADVMVEIVRQVGPMLPSLVGAFAEIAARLPRGPQAAGPPVAPPAPAPAVPTAPPPAALSARYSPALLAAVEGDAAKAERLAGVLTFCFWEMTEKVATASLPETWEDSWDRALAVVESYTPELVTNLLQWTDEQTWQAWMALDPQVVNVQTAGPWVRGFVKYVRTDRQGGTP